MGEDELDDTMVAGQSSVETANGNVSHLGSVNNGELLDSGLTASLLPPSPSRLERSESAVRRSRTRQFMRKAGDYLAYFTLLTMLVFIPIVIYRALSNRKVDKAALNSAFVMTSGTVILSLRLIYLHLTHWYMPQAQKYVVRILWMVPIYSIQSWLSLRFHTARIYIDSIRDLYEAYVISSFVYYLIELLGGQDALVQILLHKTDTELGQHPWPISLILQRWELGDEFMLQCKHGVLQYVVFKIISTILTYSFEMIGIYCEGQFSWFVAYPYLAFFQNISVMYALYCLVMLYHAVKEELESPVNWHPLGKFLCIKGVVFFTWWQGVIIFYLRAHGVIEDVGTWTSQDVAYGLIDYCIVIEMVGFAIAHSYTFTYKEYLPSNLPPVSRESLGTSDHANGADNQERRNTYHPPTTLAHPMNFRDALWSSTLPKETFEDIQRLRTGIDRIDNVLTEHLRLRGASVEMMDSNEEEGEQPEPQTTFV